MKFRMLFSASALLTALITPIAAQALEVNITADMPQVEVTHNGQKTVIMRNQDQGNTINPEFAKTSRHCPPYCVLPSVIAPGVQTIAELEVLDYLKKINDGDTSIVVIDSRTPDWVAKGTIPGSINIPWDQLNIGHSNPFDVEDLLKNQLGVENSEGFFMFDKAKTVVMFCNGAWCGQSPTNIKGLLKIGYPADKIKWYRGGMQDWEMFGFSTIKSD
ncbi:rhodanese-like domain-containing protein [Alcaligenaceae bacterium]|nr:rhodanese-like domain-containing protein [Alcaligenaceae bacterium]